MADGHRKSLCRLGVLRRSPKLVLNLEHVFGSFGSSNIFKPRGSHGQGDPGLFLHSHRHLTDRPGLRGEGGLVGKTCLEKVGKLDSCLSMHHGGQTGKQLTTCLHVDVKHVNVSASLCKNLASNHNV